MGYVMRGWPARVKLLENRVECLEKDRVETLEEIQFELVKRTDRHTRRIDAVERRQDLESKRVARVKLAIKRLRARVMSRLSHRREQK